MSNLELGSLIHTALRPGLLGSSRLPHSGITILFVGWLRANSRAGLY